MREPSADVMPKPTASAISAAPNTFQASIAVCGAPNVSGGRGKGFQTLLSASPVRPSLVTKVSPYLVRS